MKQRRKKSTFYGHTSVWRGYGDHQSAVGYDFLDLFNKIFAFQQHPDIMGLFVADRVAKTEAFGRCFDEQTFLRLTQPFVMGPLGMSCSLEVQVFAISRKARHAVSYLCQT